MKKQVKDLKAGDIMASTSGKILSIEPEFHPMYGKDKMRVRVSYPKNCPDHNERYAVKTSVWGKYTTVTLQA